LKKDLILIGGVHDNDGHKPWRPQLWQPQTMTTNLVKFIQRC